MTPEHDELRAVARRFLEHEYTSERTRMLAGADDDVDGPAWKQMAELGWAGISLPEEYGGAGYGMVERCLLLEEMGRVLAPGPFHSSAVLAADLVELAATPEARSRLLPRLADGSLRATVVTGGDLMSGAAPEGAVAATAVGDGHAVTGRGGLTFDAVTSGLLVVAARTGDGSVGLFGVETSREGVRCCPVALVDRTRKVADVEFTGAPACRLDAGASTDAAVARAGRRGAISLAAEMIGGAQRCLDMTLAYVKDRHQFGKPVGSFQAVKHRCADLALMVDVAREAVLLAAEVTDAGQEAHIPSVAAAAKMTANDAYLQATLETIQLHGGIGFTWEHDAHLFYKRALVANQTLGTTLDHRVRLAEALDV
ncbi:MAG: acyl-CoA dehydrogenase family protein [Acidimicrobiia bacterium]